MINRDLIHRLSQVNEEWCVSIYVPKQENGKKYELDQLKFNKALGTVLEHLQQKGMSEADAKALIERQRLLLNSDHLYNRYQPGILAVFFNSDSLEVVEVPEVDKEWVYVGHEFYLRPVLSLLNGMDRFFLLALDSQRIILYEGTMNRLVQSANLTDLISTSTERWNDNGESDSENEQYMKTFFRRIDSKLIELLQDEKSVLMLSASDRIGRIYQEVSQYPNILSRYVEPQSTTGDLQGLIHRAQPVFLEYLRQEKRTKRHFFVREMLEGNASISLTDILAAAMEGRVAFIFMDKEAYRTGEYKAAIKYAEVDDEPQENRTALFNLAAIKTFQTGGEVYNLERESLPDSTTSINAVFRSGTGKEL